MNNLYPTTEVYALHGDMCYENKVMASDTLRLNLPPPPPPPPPTGTCEKPNICRMLGRFRFTLLADIATTIIVICALLAIESGVIPQRKLGFRCKDPSISYPYTGDTITLIHLLIGSYLGPLVVIAFVECVREKSLRDIRACRVWEHYKEFLIGASFVLLVTEMAKAMLGEHRPHFFEVCRPDANEMCTAGEFVESYSCTNDAFNSWTISDSSKSFPSGHSSLSVFSALFTAYVVQSRLPSAVTGRLFKPFLITICLSWGILCSLSRIADRRHHWWDVLCGTVLGILGVIFFTTIFHQRQKRKLLGTSDKSVSSTMLLDVKSKSSTSARV